MWARRKVCPTSSPYSGDEEAASNASSTEVDDGFEEESSEIDAFTQAVRKHRLRLQRPWGRWAAIGGLGLVIIAAVTLFGVALHLNHRLQCPAELRKEIDEYQMPNTSSCGEFGGKRVIVVTASSEFVVMFKNWYKFARRWLGEDDQLVVVAHDAESYLRLSEIAHRRVPSLFRVFHAEQLVPKVQPVAESPGQVTEEPSGIINAWEYQSPGYGSVVNRRPNQLNYFLKQGCTVVYSDIDMVWQKSPLKELEPVRHDFYVGLDECDEKSWWHRTFNPTEGNQCTCFLYLKPTPPVIKLMTAWSDKLSMQDVNDKWVRYRNQPAFQAVFREIGHCIDWQPLDYKEHPPGCRVYDYQNATVLHVNWVWPATLQKKIDRLKDLGVWDPDW